MKNGTNTNQNIVYDAAETDKWGLQFTNATSWTAVAKSTSLSYEGNSGSHNNLQPYLCVYIFKRTA